MAEAVARPAIITTRTAVVVLCWALVFFDGFDVVSFGAVVPTLLTYDSWDVTPADVGAIGALTLVGMALGAVAAGVLVRRWGRRRLLAGCLAWFSIAVGVAALAPTELIFGGFRILAGLGLGCLLPVASALVLERARPARRNLTYGAMFSAYPFGGMVAGIVAGRLTPAGDFRTPMAVGVLALLVLPGVLVVLRHEDAADRSLPDRPESGPGTWRQAPASDLFAERGGYPTVLLWLAGFMCLLVIYGLLTWLPSIMHSAGYELGSAVAFLAVLSLGGVAGMLVAGWAADRFGVRRVAGLACLGAGASIGLLSLRPPTAIAFVLIALAGMAAIGAQIVINACVADFYSAPHRAAALGWSLGVGRLGAIAAPPLGAVIVVAGLGAEWHFYAFAAAALLAALALNLVARSVGATPVQH